MVNALPMRNESAVESMLQSNKDAAACLFKHGANACTDITGFGLAGHLREMASPASMTCEINLARVPFLPGAEEASQLGIASTLYPQNVLVERYMEVKKGADQSPSYQLLFDPQTSGGLVASIPESQVQACVQDLNSLGYEEAAVVGKVATGDSGEKPIRIVD